VYYSKLLNKELLQYLSRITYHTGVVASLATVVLRASISLEFLHLVSQYVHLFALYIY